VSLVFCLKGGVYSALLVDVTPLHLYWARKKHASATSYIWYPELTARNWPTGVIRTQFSALNGHISCVFKSKGNWQNKICGGYGLHLRTAVWSNYVLDDSTALNTFLSCEDAVWNTDCVSLQNKTFARGEAFVAVCFSIIFSRMRWYRAEPTSAAEWASSWINHYLCLKCQKLLHSAAAADNSDNVTVEGCERRVSLTHYCDWRARSNFVGSGKAYCAHDYCIAAHECQHQHPPPIVTDWASTKAIPVRAWTGPEVSRRLRLPDFKTVGTWRR